MTTPSPTLHRDYSEQPSAVMGYAYHPRTGYSIRVCSWCPDKDAAEQFAKPLPVTHGICPACAQAMNERVAP